MFLLQQCVTTVLIVANLKLIHINNNDIISYTTKKSFLLGMHRQTASELLYDVLYITINRKNEEVKTHNRHKYIKTQIYLYIYIFLYNIKMEPSTFNNGINAIKKVRELFNELRSNLSREETKKIREKLHKKEVVYNFLKDKTIEQEGSLTNKQKSMLKDIDKNL